VITGAFGQVGKRCTEILLSRGRTVVAVLHDLDRVRRHFPSTLLLARSPIAWGDTSLSLSADNLARGQKALLPPVGARIGWVT